MKIDIEKEFAEALNKFKQAAEKISEPEAKAQAYLDMASLLSNLICWPNNNDDDCYEDDNDDNDNNDDNDIETDMNIIVSPAAPEKENNNSKPKLKLNSLKFEKPVMVEFNDNHKGSEDKNEPMPNIIESFEIEKEAVISAQKSEKEFEIIGEDTEEDLSQEWNEENTAKYNDILNYLFDIDEKDHNYFVKTIKEYSSGLLKNIDDVMPCNVNNVYAFFKAMEKQAC